MMALGKDAKAKFVEAGKSAVSKYPVVGIVPLSAVPDRLFQSAKNKMRKNTTFIMGRKTLLTRILESSEKTKALAGKLTGTSAIVLTNEDPFKLYRDFKAGAIKLGAKPNQISPVDINISAGDTSIQPGQAVTELKLAGIDVQIQKGKVVIAKDKILVKKGGVITPAISKALKTLEIMPFTAVIEPSVLLSGNITFTSDVLSIDAVSVSADVSRAFAYAYTISIKAKIVNSYTVKSFIETAYRNSIALGVGAKLAEPGIIDILLAQAAAGANALNTVAKDTPQ
jgi:large subunit ribosomal protein L10